MTTTTTDGDAAIATVNNSQRSCFAFANVTAFTTKAVILKGQSKVTGPTVDT